MIIDKEPLPLSKCIDHVGRKVRCVSAPRSSIFKAGSDYTVISRKEFADRPASLGVDPDGNGITTGQPDCLFVRIGEGISTDVELSEPENVELRMDDDGVKRWYIGTRDGWQHAGHKGLTLELSAEHFNVGTTITLVEPLAD